MTRSINSLIISPLLLALTGNVLFCLLLSPIVRYSIQDEKTGLLNIDGKTGIKKQWKIAWYSSGRISK